MLWIQTHPFHFITLQAYPIDRAIATKFDMAQGQYNASLFESMLRRVKEGAGSPPG